MFALSRALIGAALAALLASTAVAQPGAERGAGVPSLPAATAFEGYQPFAAQPVAPWRESNDTVGRIGGWRAYAREAAAPAAAAPAPAASPAGAAAPAAPMPRQGHQNHHSHGGRP